MPKKGTKSLSQQSKRTPQSADKPKEASQPTAKGQGGKKKGY